MGGCSGKPKTAEFDGAMDMQEEKPQDEAARRSAEAGRIGVDAGLKGINKEQESLEGGLQNPIVEEERHDLRDVLAERTKHLSAGFDADGKSLGEKPILEDDHNSVKKVGKNDISKNCFSERQTAVEEETPELGNDSKILAPASSQLHEDNVSASEHKKTLDTMNSPEHPKRSIEMQDQPVSFDNETQAAEKLTSHDKRAFHLQEQVTTLKDEFLKSEKDVYVDAERTLTLPDSVAPKDIGLELQKDPFEEEVKREVNWESQKAGHGFEGEMLVIKEKQIGTVGLESQDMSKEATKGVVEMDSRGVHENGGHRLVNNLQQKNQFEESKDCHITAHGPCILDNYSEERGKEVLGEKSLLLRKNLSAKDEAVDAANFDASIGDQQSLTVERSCSLDDGVHEEQMQAKVVHEAASTHAFVAQAVPISGHVDNDLQKESSGEVTSNEGWYILEKVDVNNHPSAEVFKEHIHLELPKKADDVPREISRAAGLCDEVVVLSADQVAHPKVIAANEEKPEAQHIHVMDPVGLAFKNISAQEMNAPDIDDVWEKLASEFERQESLSRFNS